MGMLNRRNTVALLFSLVIACASAHAEPLAIPEPPAIDASSYILMDHDSGMVLAEHDSGLRVDPASITKIMTAYIVYKALATNDISLEDLVTVSEKAWRSIGSRMFIEVGEEVLLEDLLLGMIVQSGNDASVALAEHVAGTEEAFADIMNAEAQRMNLQDTHFTNVTGLPGEQHYTTAHDVAVLSRALIEEFPEEYMRYAQKEFTYNNIRQHNRNRLLWRNGGVDGLKTGYTKNAGYCLAASARRDDMRLISVLMGASNSKLRMKGTQSLLDYGFRFYESHTLYEAGETLLEQRMWDGEAEQITLGLEEDLRVAIPRGHYESLKATMDVEKEIVAPIHRGDRLGTVKIMLQGEEYLTRPLVALRDNPQGNAWRRIVDFFSQLFT